MPMIRTGLVVVCLVLAGCTTGPSDDSVAAVPIPAIKPPDPGGPARPRARHVPPHPQAAAPVVPVVSEGALPAAPAPAAPAPAPAPVPAPLAGPTVAVAPRAPPAINPDRLVGLDEDGVRRLLGPPERSDDQSPGRTWNYARGPCTLKVFFFMDMTEQRFRALSYQVTSSEGSAHADPSCLANFVAEAAADRPFDRPGNRD